MHLSFVPWRQVVLFSEVTNLLSLWEVEAVLFSECPLWGGSTVHAVTMESEAIPNMPIVKGMHVQCAMLMHKFVGEGKLGTLLTTNRNYVS